MRLHLWQDPCVLWLEIIFTVVSAGLCFVVYRKTKGIYELTRYPGVGFFREAFLFLGLSFIMRFLFGVILLSREVFDVMLPRQLFVPLSIMPLGYLSTAALVYLFLSASWKRIAARFSIDKAVIAGNIIAAVVPILAFFTRSHEILAWLQLALLVMGIASALFVDSKGKRFSQMRRTYFLMFGLWVLALWSTGPSPRMLFQLRFLLDAACVAVLVVIYRKMMKWIK